MRLAPDELIIDNFAGGGGASTAIFLATGRHPDYAINHDAQALGMHAANHPETIHLCEDVFAVSPRKVCRGRRVGLAWFSPDCKHFSKAKGGKPVEKKIRGLAWVAVRWAEDVHPRMIYLENVEEFETWGPVVDGRPCPDRKGHTYRRWKGRLEALGYKVEARTLVAADYGAPTTRKRLFLVARCDGLPIIWPTPSHGQGRALPWRTAAECIDFSIPCPSIFERERPLAENTLRRVAVGVQRFVIDAPQPFIVPVTHPGDQRVHSINEPLRTITGANGGELALVSPTLIQTGYGERPGQAPRVPGLHKPLGTVVAGQKHALVAAFLAKHNGIGAKMVVGQDLFGPVHTITGTDQKAVVASSLVKLRGTSRDGQRVTEPLGTVSAQGNHFAEVRAFLIKFHRDGGQWQDLFGPLHTVPTRDSLGLVMVHGELHAIVDIGLRMLQPRELFTAQGFPLDYIIDRTADGTPLPKHAQVRMCGNSVSPPPAEALIRANLFEADEIRRAA